MPLCFRRSNWDARRTQTWAFEAVQNEQTYKNLKKASCLVLNRPAKTKDEERNSSHVNAAKDIRAKGVVFAQV